MIKRVPLPICIILILSFFLQLGLSAAFNDIYNTANMRTFASLALKGNPFPLTLAQSTEFGPIDWPYPPLCIAFLLLPTLIYQATGSELLFQLAFKLPLILAILITGGLIYAIARRNDASERSARVATALFLLNPAILLRSSTGGWECLSIVFFLASYWLLVHSKKVELSATMLGFAVAIRIYPIILLPLSCIYVWKRQGHRKAIAYALLALMPMVISTVPFIIADASAFWKIVGRQQASFGPLSSFVVIDAVLGRFGLPSTLLAMILIAILIWRLFILYIDYNDMGRSLIDSSFFALLLLLLYHPKVHWGYPLALLPFALLSQNRWARLTWLPGLLYALLINGTQGATGLFYWTAWRTGLYVATWEYIRLASRTLFPITFLLIAAQAALLLLAMRAIPSIAAGRLAN